MPKPRCRPGGRAQAIARCDLAGECLLKAVPELFDSELESGELEYFFALEVAIDAALLQSGGAHDVGDAGALVAALIE